jgi:hypothetical protein
VIEIVGNDDIIRYEGAERNAELRREVDEHQTSAELVGGNRRLALRRG